MDRALNESWKTTHKLKLSVLLATLLLALILGSTQTALAQSRFTFTPYAGALYLDGSCVLWENGECAGHFAGGDPAFVGGIRGAYQLDRRWTVEGTVAWAEVDGDIPVVPVDQASLSDRSGGGEGIPFNVLGRLYTGSLRYRLMESNRAVLFVTGSMGVISFDESGWEGRSFDDLLLGGGVGAELGEGPIRLRGDVRGFSQPCAESGGREGFTCDNGSILGHLELSTGIVLTFPGIQDPAGGGDP